MRGVQVPGWPSVSSSELFLLWYDEFRRRAGLAGRLDAGSEPGGSRGDKVPEPGGAEPGGECFDDDGSEDSVSVTRIWRARVSSMASGSPKAWFPDRGAEGGDGGAEELPQPTRFLRVEEGCWGLDESIFPETIKFGCDGRDGWGGPAVKVVKT